MGNHQTVTPRSNTATYTLEGEEFEVQSSTNSHTFRDTEMEEVEAIQLRKI